MPRTKMSQRESDSSQSTKPVTKRKKKSDKPLSQGVMVTTLPPGSDILQTPPPVKKRGRPVGSGKAPVVVIEPHISRTGKTTVKYLNNADLLKAVLESKQQGKMTDTLCRMLMLLIRRYATKGSFINYSFNDEMQSFALCSLVKSWSAFNEEKSSSCFAYYTRCVHNSFIQYMAIEKKQRKIRDAMMIDGGLMPSYACQLDYADQYHTDRSGDYDDSVREYNDFAPHPTSGGYSGGGFSSSAIDRHFERVDVESDVDIGDDLDETVGAGIASLDALDSYDVIPDDIDDVMFEGDLLDD